MLPAVVSVLGNSLVFDFLLLFCRLQKMMVLEVELMSSVVCIIILVVDGCPVVFA